jgi:hypothetical protein
VLRCRLTGAPTHISSQNCRKQDDPSPRLRRLTVDKYSRPAEKETLMHWTLEEMKFMEDWNYTVVYSAEAVRRDGRGLSAIFC